MMVFRLFANEVAVAQKSGTRFWFPSEEEKGGGAGAAAALPKSIAPRH